MDAQLSRRLDRIENLQLKTREDIAALKVKSGVWGALAGLIPVLLGFAYLAVQ